MLATEFWAEVPKLLCASVSGQRQAVEHVEQMDATVRLTQRVEHGSSVHAKTASPDAQLHHVATHTVCHHKLYRRSEVVES